VSAYGRPGTKVAALREAVHKRLIAHAEDGTLPTSNRFVLYELRQIGGPLYGHKSRRHGRSEDQNLSEASMWLRDHGLVPWGWVADETRTVVEYLYAGSVAEYVTGSVGRARIDVWGGSPPPLIVCESRTFGGVMERTVGEEYLCPVTATNGQAGGFLHTNLAPLLTGEHAGRPVLYIGDLDLRGADIEANTRRVLEQTVGPLDWRRVALTTAQVEEHDLPIVTKQDKAKGAHAAVEVEALGQGIVTALVREALDDLLPEPLAQVQVREREQQREVRVRLNGGGS
jgi:hypothetical protein